MNPLLSRLQPYPFERLRQLHAGITPAPHFRPISLGIGEPRHPTPAFIEEALVAALPGLSTYPATAGEPALREAAAAWVAAAVAEIRVPLPRELPIVAAAEEDGMVLAAPAMAVPASS